LALFTPANGDSIDEHDHHQEQTQLNIKQKMLKDDFIITRS
jgi:hypothetical protein